MMPSVVGWLSAAALHLAEKDIATVHPQQVDGRFSRTDAKAVGNAGYEEMNAWSGVCHDVLYALST
jgi:hypothetical protein